MNSDNSALGGVTLDYGPFAFMEKFVPMYNPWVGGGTQYAFGRQPQAAAVNLAGLAPSFIELVQLVGTEEGLTKAERDAAVEEIKQAVQMGYVDTFHAKHDDNCRAKLGLAAWDDDAQELWDALFKLMASRCGAGGLDFTIFFRSLSDAEPAEAELVRGALAQAALQPTAQVRPVLSSPFCRRAARSTSEPRTAQNRPEPTPAPCAPAPRPALRTPRSAPRARARARARTGPNPSPDPRQWPTDHVAEWEAWAERYTARLAKEARSAAERRTEMNLANPRYILRNWMAAEAYEAAERGDFGPVREVHKLLCNPYEEQVTRAGFVQAYDAAPAQPPTHPPTHPSTHPIAHPP